MRQITIVIALLLLVALATSPVAAKEPSGKVLYIDNCKPCHGPNSPDGEYSPLTLIQDQWERFFDKKLVKSHQDVMAPDREGKKLLEVLTEKELKKIRKFTIDHAADSENPMTCG